MKYLEESNKNLISLRTSLIAVVTLLTGGITGILLSDTDNINKRIIFCIGGYFDVLFIFNILRANKMIDNNIGAIKNDRK